MTKEPINVVTLKRTIENGETENSKGSSLRISFEGDLFFSKF